MLPTGAGGLDPVLLGTSALGLVLVAPTLFPDGEISSVLGFFVLAAWLAVADGHHWSRLQTRCLEHCELVVVDYRYMALTPQNTAKHDLRHQGICPFTFVAHVRGSLDCGRR